MTIQPRRLMESPAGDDDLLARAVQASRAVDPSPAELDALQVRLLEALASAPSQSPALWASGSVKRVSRFAGLIVLGALGAYIALRRDAPAPPVQVSIQKPMAASMPKVSDVPVVGESVSPVTVPAPTERPRASRAPKVSTPPEPVEARGELDLLRDAEAALRQDPAAALQFTDRHLHAYPSGILTQEREVIGVQALLGLGKRDAAQARAERFRAAYPTSPLLRRLSRVLARGAPVGNEGPVETSTPQEVKP